MKTIIWIIIGMMFYQNILYCSERIERPNRLTATVFGLGSPVGFAGAAYEFLLYPENVGLEVGVGTGITGDQYAMDSRWYYGKGKKINGNVLFGATYSTGIKPDTVGEDRNKDGIEGKTASTPDAIWLNLSTGFDVTTGIGFIYGMDVGISAIIATEMAVKYQSATEPLSPNCHYFPCQGGWHLKPGMTIPTITPLRMGYAW